MLWKQSKGLMNPCLHNIIMYTQCSYIQKLWLWSDRLCRCVTDCITHLFLDLRMSNIVVCLLLSVIYLFPVSVTIASGQGQLTDILSAGKRWWLAVSFNGGKGQGKRQDPSNCCFSNYCQHMHFPPPRQTRLPLCHQLHWSQERLYQPLIMQIMTRLLPCHHLQTQQPWWVAVDQDGGMLFLSTWLIPATTALLDSVWHHIPRRHVDDHIELMEDALQPHSVLEVYHTNGCVGGWRDSYQFGATSAFWQYTCGIDSYYVDGVSLTHGSAGRRQHIWTFAAGVSEVVILVGPMKSVLVIQEAMIVSLHLLEMITSVRVAYIHPGPIISSYSMLMMSSGMVRAAHPPAHAVSPTILHGLQRTWPLQLMTLNWGFALAMDHEVMMFPSNSLSFMCNE